MPVHCQSSTDRLRRFVPLLVRTQDEFRGGSGGGDGDVDCIVGVVWFTCVNNGEGIAEGDQQSWSRSSQFSWSSSKDLSLSEVIVTLLSMSIHAAPADQSPTDEMSNRIEQNRVDLDLT